MDTFFKNTKLVLDDNDVHVIGTTCLHIATKYEDIYHIPLKKLLSSACYNKFTKT